MIGKRILNYEITERLGEGGMGVVYKATDTLLGREVALKMLHSPLISQPQFLDRFKKEARILAQLLHPNIAVIYNFIEHDSNHYMVMEYVQGTNLDSLLRQYKTISHNAIIPVFTQTLEGLQHAHKKGIFHRDIKPSNLILAEDGTVKLMDFGIAKMAGEQRITQVNRVVGTVEYMAPELIQGKDPSAASDIYATGVTMYELLTGKLPFESTTDFNLMQEILKKRPPSPDKLNSAIPKSLANIINKSLEKKPENRFKDARTFQHALMMAFPELAEMNVNDMLQQTVPQVKATQIISSGGINTSTGKTQATRIETFTRPLTTVLNNIKKAVLAKERRPVVLIVSSIIFAGILLLAASSGRKKSKLANIPEVQTTSDQTEDGNDAANNRNEYGGNNNVIPGNSDENNGSSIITPVNTNETGAEEKKKEKKEKSAGSETKKEEDPKKKEETKDPSDVKKIDPPKPPEKKEEPATPKSKVIFIEDRLDVPLYLQNAINPSAAREGQSLKFSVTRSISYKGETIINKGAVANGKITKVSKRKISVVIDNVLAANGQYIPLQDIELSGRIEEIASSRNYTAKLKKGGIIKF